MQRLAVEARELLLHRLGQIAELGLEALAIDRIADHGRADRGEMHADLMRAPGLERAFDQRGDRGLADRRFPARDNG